MLSGDAAAEALRGSTGEGTAVDLKLRAMVVDAGTRQLGLEKLGHATLKRCAVEVTTLAKVAAVDIYGAKTMLYLRSKPATAALGIASIDQPTPPAKHGSAISCLQIVCSPPPAYLCELSSWTVELRLLGEVWKEGENYEASLIGQFPSRRSNVEAVGTTRIVNFPASAASVEVADLEQVT